MALNAVRLASGTLGSDWLAGDFHGPNHDEIWGIPDTTDYIGAFGTRRDP